MSDEPAETFSADAVRWIDGLSDPSGLRGSWRLQVLEHRVTVKETGTDPETGVKTYSQEMRPVRLTRFAKGCPWALVPEAERYLLSLAPYTGKIVNGVDIPGTYKPTRTRWIRDDQTNLDDPRRSTNENRHTLVQDLVEASAADGDSVPQSSDCVETVVAEYRWDEPSLPEAGDLPAASQGVAVSVQQVSRQEDGTYRYAIVTRTAKTRVGTEATVECTAFRSVVQQDFVNLYGDPGTGFEDEAGNGVEVPSQTCGAGGVDVEWRNLRQNDDCTWSVSVVTTAGTAVSDAERTSSETATERRDTRKDAAQANSLQHVKVQDPAVATAEGHVWEQRSELRPDGLYDNTVTKRDEKQLANQVVEKRRTVRGTTVRTVNRNMPSAAADPSGIGTVVNTVTDSGRVTQEITEVDRSAQPVDAGSACSTTVFEHVESDRTVRPDKPAKHWQAAGGGHRYERTSRITEEGSYEVLEEDRQELRRTDARVTVRKTLRGTQRTVVDRNVAAPLSETGLAVGETRQSEVTPGGLYNTTKTVTTAEAAGTVGTECQKTVFEHTDSTTSNQAAQPPAEADEAGDGRTRRRSARRTEEGTWDVITVTTEEKTQPGSTKSWRKTLRGTQETTVDRNAVAALNGAGLKVGETRTSETTPGGRYNNTTVTVTAGSAGDIGTDCQKTVFEHVDSTTANVADKPATEADEAGNGTIRRKTLRETEEGTWDVTTQITTEKPRSGAVKSWRKTLRGTQETTVDRNSAAALTGSGLNIGETRTSEMTPGGLYNNTTVTVTAGSAGKTGEACVNDRFRHRHSSVENVEAAGGGLPDVEVQFSKGKVVRKDARMTDAGTVDVTTETVTGGAPFVEKCDYRRGDGAEVHVRKYYNYPLEYTGYPDGADGLTVDDSVDELGLHSGVVKWLTDVPYSTFVTDEKFRTHGERVDLYESRYDKYMRRNEHRKWTVQLVHVRGYAYSHYVQQRLSANPDRETYGLLYVRKISGPYANRNGEMLAEWEEIVGWPAEGDWTPCSDSCKHDKWGPGAMRSSMEGLLDKAGNAEETTQPLVAALREIAAAMTAAMNANLNGRGR